MSPCYSSAKKKGCRYVYLDVYDGEQICRRAFCKIDVAQDGCTVLCRADHCYKIGHHRCAACELEAYCSEACRLKDRRRHEKDCQENTPQTRQQMMKNFDRQAPCSGLPDCQCPVVSVCPNCESAVCHRWECSKAHLEVCESYLDQSIQREWVIVEWARRDQLDRKTKKRKCESRTSGEEEDDDDDDWVLVSHQRCAPR